MTPKTNQLDGVVFSQAETAKSVTCIPWIVVRHQGCLASRVVGNTQEVLGKVVCTNQVHKMHL